MPDFNKGDFTQQGVAGHVNANLRLNEKRLVNLDLTTNEEAEGCTITGSVKDLLNDKVYAVGAAKTILSKTITENGTYNASADDCDGYNPVTVNVPQPSGNIAITENTPEGEPLNIAQYATATVNVSGGGVPFIIPLQTVSTSSSGYRELPLGANLENMSVGDRCVLKMSGSYYGMPLTGYVIGTVDDLTPGDEHITFTGNFGTDDSPMNIHIDVSNTPGFTETWGIMLLINSTMTAIPDIEVSAVAW